MDFFSFAGRFHPVIVHLPIGILLLGVLFQWLSEKAAFSNLRSSISTILFIGSCFAVLACITGILLSQSDTYNASAVTVHQVLAISATVLSFAYWYVQKKQLQVAKSFSVLIFLLITLTGHFGGTLTHGEGYLTEYLTEPEKPFDLSSINLSKAKYYDELVRPILSQRCYTCHGATKQKGKLRLDGQQFILTGGKDGLVLVPGKPEESEMINRLLLPLDDEDHMPPKEKGQPSSIEIAVLKKWVERGADFNKKISELLPAEEVNSIFQTTSSISDVPSENVAVPSQKKVDILKKWGAVVIPVAENSNYLSVSLINATLNDTLFSALADLRKQIIWLNAGNTKLDDVQLMSLKTLSDLTRIHLENTLITDDGLSALSEMKNLSYVNLSGTNVSGKGILILTDLTLLKNLYLFKTQVQPSDLPAIQQRFSAVRIDTGNYRVPTLPTDTTEVLPPKTN